MQCLLHTMNLEHRHTFAGFHSPPVIQDSHQNIHGQITFILCRWRFQDMHPEFGGETTTIFFTPQWFYNMSQQQFWVYGGCSGHTREWGSKIIRLQISQCALDHCQVKRFWHMPHNTYAPNTLLRAFCSASGRLKGSLRFTSCLDWRRRLRTGALHDDYKEHVLLHKVQVVIIQFVILL